MARFDDLSELSKLLFMPRVSVHSSFFFCWFFFVVVIATAYNRHCYGNAKLFTSSRLCA